MERIRVLLVDDHTLVRNGLKVLLEGQCPVEVVGEAAGSNEAVAVTERVPVDLAIVDLNLPEPDGFWCVSELHRRHPGLPILVLSMREDVGAVVRAMQAGACGYLVKSATSDEMRAAVEAVRDGGCYLHPRISGAVLGRLREGCHKLGGDTWSRLGERESALIGFVALGWSNQAIATRLHVSLGTVKNDLRNLFRRLGVPDRTRLAVEAIQRGWAPPEELE
ncbi:MAG: response regulator transcription factor [Candidatus Eremiobacterota bacterium]